jgi:hypothetical protein
MASDFERQRTFLLFATLIWSASAAAVIVERKNILALYAGSSYRPTMAGTGWECFPIIATVALLITFAATVVFRSQPRMLFGSRFRYLIVAFGASGIVYLYFWFLQMVIDIKAVQ